MSNISSTKMPKDTKEIKNTKKEEIKEVKDEKQAHNKATTAAGLNFNVNATRKWLKEQFTVIDTECPKLSGSHIALTAATEAFIQILIQNVINKLPKETSGLYNLSYASIIYGIQMEDELDYVFSKYLRKFDRDANYVNELWIPKKDVMTFIEKLHGENIKIDERGFNALAYVIIKFGVLLTRTAHNLMEYSKRKTMDSRSFVHAIKEHFNDGVRNQLLMKIDDAIKQMGEDDSDDEKEETKEEKKETKEEKKEEKKDTKGKKEEKKDTKPVKKGKESDSESDSDSDSNSSSSESEDEKPVAKKGVKTNKK